MVNNFCSNLFVKLMWFVAIINRIVKADATNTKELFRASKILIMDDKVDLKFLIETKLRKSLRIYEVYQKRWRIEEYHKSIKQNASLEKSPIKVVKSQKNHIFASIVAYCKLEFLKTKTSLNHFGMKYMLLMKANRAVFLELERWRFNHGKF